MNSRAAQQFTNTKISIKIFIIKKNTLDKNQPSGRKERRFLTEEWGQEQPKNLSFIIWEDQSVIFILFLEWFLSVLYLGLLLSTHYSLHMMYLLVFVERLSELLSINDHESSIV